MALLDDVAIRLRDQGVGGLPGTTQLTDTGWMLTKSFMPPDPDKCITLYETGGFPGEAIPELNYPTFQVKVRSGTTGYSTGREKLDACEDALNLQNTTINSVYYVRIHHLSDAIALGFDGEDRPMIGQNFRALRSR